VCDACLEASGVLRLLRLQPNDRRDPIRVAQDRLRCYYECVTRDMLEEDDFNDDRDEDPFDEFTPEL